MRKYNIWSREEMKALSCGVEKYGVGNWDSILEDPDFGLHLTNRSRRDLKNKCQHENMKNKVATPPRKIKYEKWSYEEEDALLLGIEQYGLGKWQNILDDPEFGFYLFTRSIQDLKNKCRKKYFKIRITALEEKCLKSGIQKRHEALSRNDLMPTPPLGPSSSKISGKKVIEKDSDSEDYDHQCTLKPQRRRARSHTLKEAKKSNSERVHDDLLHQSPLSSEESSKDESVEELSDFEDYRYHCTVAPQRRRTSKKKINRAKRLKSQRNHDNMLHQPSLSNEESSEIELVEELGDFEDYHITRTIPRHIRRSRNNMRNQTRKLSSDKVHDYLVDLWRNFPEDKRSSFAHIDPLWFTFYSGNSNKERVLSWIKKKDVFSRKYVVFPIVQWGHWSVLIFCHFGEALGSEVKTPCILLLDSLEKTDHSKQLEPIIRRFVSELYESLEMIEDKKMLRKMPFLVPKVPQQRDGEECGYFVLYYIKLFVQNAPENFSISDGYPYFMKKDWFTFEELDSFCKVFDSSHK